MMLQTKTQIEQQVRSKLQELLDDYNADMEIIAGDILISVPVLYDDNHNCIREGTEVNLGGYIWAKPVLK